MRKRLDRDGHTTIQGTGSFIDPLPVPGRHPRGQGLVEHQRHQVGVVEEVEQLAEDARQVAAVDLVDEQDERPGRRA